MTLTRVLRQLLVPLEPESKYGCRPERMGEQGCSALQTSGKANKGWGENSTIQFKEFDQLSGTGGPPPLSCLGVPGSKASKSVCRAFKMTTPAAAASYQAHAASCA